MARPFPDHPNLVGGFAPIQMECDAADLDHRLPFGFHGNWMPGEKPNGL